MSLNDAPAGLFTPEQLAWLQARLPPPAVYLLPSRAPRRRPPPPPPASTAAEPGERSLTSCCAHYSRTFPWGPPPRSPRAQPAGRAPATRVRKNNNIVQWLNFFIGCCRTALVRFGGDARPRPPAHPPDVHPRRGAGLGPRRSGRGRPGPAGPPTGRRPSGLAARRGLAATPRARALQPRRRPTSEGGQAHPGAGVRRNVRAPGGRLARRPHPHRHGHPAPPGRQ